MPLKNWHPILIFKPSRHKRAGWETNVKAKKEASRFPPPTRSRGFQRLISMESQYNLTPAEAVAAIVLAVISIDGEIVDTEIEGAGWLLGRMNLFKMYSTEALSDMLMRLFSIMEEISETAIIDIAKESLPPKLWLTAYVLAVDLALADGILHPNEKVFIANLQKSLNIPHDKADEIMQVMLIKSRG